MDPWKSSAVKDFMRRYYDAMLRWLAAGTGPEFKVAGVFNWNLVSWDVQGIHPIRYGGCGAGRGRRGGLQGGSSVAAGGGSRRRA